MKSNPPHTPKRNLELCALGCAVFCCAVSLARAGILFEETFDTDAADTASFDIAYPAFTTTTGGGKAVTATGGRAEITASTDANTLGSATVPGFPGEVTYSVDVGANNNYGSYNVGMVIGGNRVVFHPGHTPTPGALRVEGTGGFGNQDMGFVPANGVLHHLQVKQNPNGLFEITFTDGEDPSKIYTNSWTNLAAVGQPFGIVRNGPRIETAFYDNLRAEDPSAIPFEITDITLLAGDRISLTWNSRPNAIYTVFWSTDLIDFSPDVSDNVASQGDSTTFEFDNPTVSIENPVRSPMLFFRAAENN